MRRRAEHPVGPALHHIADVHTNLPGTGGASIHTPSRLRTCNPPGILVQQRQAAVIRMRAGPYLCWVIRPRCGG